MKFKIGQGFIQNKIQGFVFQALKSLGIEGVVTEKDIVVEHPANETFGDYATNIAMVAFSKLKVKSGKLLEIKNPVELAKILTGKIKKIKGSENLFEKVEIAGSGFINFTLKKEYLFGKAQELLDKEKFKEAMGEGNKGKHILLEHTSPEPTKTIHIGHLRNNFLGISVHNLLEMLGYQVTLDCINNDRGMKICRTIWGYLVFGKKKQSVGINDFIERIKDYKLSDEEISLLVKDVDWRKFLEEWTSKTGDWYQPEDFNLGSDKFDNVFYSPAHRATELLPAAADDIQSILKAWEDGDKNVRKVWRQIIDWSMSGYEKTYKRVGSWHDKVWNESEFYKLGKKWVEKGLKLGVFKKLPDGAVLSDLKDYGLTDAILMKKDGTSLYHTQDLQLTYQKVTTYPSDLYIWDIGNDQKLYLKQLYAMCEQLGIVKREKCFHMNYGFISLKGGAKMSSRYGGVVNSDDLLDELHQRARKIIDESDSELRGDMTDEEKENLAEKVAVSALKYGFLKYSRENDFAFDIDESLSIQGNSGPYLQYTYARCASVLTKAKEENYELRTMNYELKIEISNEELSLLRTFYQFEEVIQESVRQFSPHIMCLYLFTLAQKFNLFYQKHRILTDNSQPGTGRYLADNQQPNKEIINHTSSFRLFLTAVTAQILKIGLGLLGIEVLRKM